MTAYYNENDPYCAAWLRNLIKAGHIPMGDVDERDIREVAAADIRGYRQCHFFAGIGGWPYALRLVGWPDARPVWTGSCPCQPFSVAGNRKGNADERHLWPQFARLIGECAPAIVFGEQVAGSDGREWLAGVRADLEALGYAVGAADLCAAGVGAPHIRQRLFWVADAAAPGTWRRGILGPGESARPDAERASGELAGCGLAGGLGDADDEGLQARKRENLFGARGREEGRTVGQSSRAPGSGLEHAASEQMGIPGQPRQQRDTVDCADGKTRRIEPGSFPLAHGISNRVGRLRAYGNAIVPQVAAEVIRVML